MMKRWYYPALALLTGFFTAQVLATAQVYLSNTELYRTIVTIKDAGYFPIPNEQIIPHLQELRPAFFGGLFFTLTTGAGLSLLSLAFAWIWDRLLHRKRSFLILFILLPVVFIALVNHRGFNPMVSLYFLILPPAVFTATLRWIPPQTRQRGWLDRMISAVPLLLLAMLWTSQMDRHLFLDLRDKLLLSNPVGVKVNDFYYAYTLYPAEVFKSMDQKTLKTCNLEGSLKRPVVEALERPLLTYDYLDVGKGGPVDLEIIVKGSNLVFRNRGKTIVSTTLQHFLSVPATVLKEFSAKSDRHLFFRQFTFFSLLIGFPLALYILLYTALRLISNLFLNSRPASLIASILCFTAGATLLFILHLGGAETIRVENLGEALESENWQKRVKALKVIEEKRIEIGDFQGYPGMLRSPHIPERYWLVRALGVSQRPETYQDLMTFLDDPHPTVVGIAYYALGQRGETKAINEIMRRIEASDHWYNQWHAYRALRALGWKQSKRVQSRSTLRLPASKNPRYRHDVQLPHPRLH